MPNLPILELAPEQSGENFIKQLAPFDSFKEQVAKLKLTAETLVVNDISDKAGMKLARATRLALRDVRIAIEHRRKELGEHHLRETQRINADAKAIKELIEPLELRLADQENYIEREIARIHAENKAARTAEITPFLLAAPMFDLGALSDADWTAHLADAKAMHEARLAREAKEKADADAERERVRLQATENERLKAEAVEKEKAEQAEREKAAAVLAALEKKLADERMAAAAEAAKLKAEVEAKAKADREAADAKAKAQLDAERKAAQQKLDDEKVKAAAEAKKLREESAERERVIQDRATEAQRIADENARAQAAKAEQERKAREQAEAALAKQQAAEAKVAADKLAAEQAAAAAPDKQKLEAFATAIRDIDIPNLDRSRDDLAMKLRAQVEKLASWIEAHAEAI